jgi:hypothetical protein
VASVSSSRSSHTAIPDILRLGHSEGRLCVNEEQGIYRGEVMAIMFALADLQVDARAILAILTGRGRR